MVFEYNFQNANVAVRQAFFSFSHSIFSSARRCLIPFSRSFLFILDAQSGFLSSGSLLACGDKTGLGIQAIADSSYYSLEKCSLHRSSLCLVKIFSVSQLQICLCFCSFCNQEHCFLYCGLFPRDVGICCQPLFMLHDLGLY